ncbi:NAD(P)H-hydrate epimerase [Candidatus Margulisiibacteriota bacterium]
MKENYQYKYQTCSVSEARMRDSWAIKHLKIPSIILMENAGIQVVNTICHPRGESPAVLKSEDKVLVLAGSGNNGGDGLVIARHLQRLGHKVTILMCDGMSETDDAETNWTIAFNLDMTMLDAYAEDVGSVLSEGDVIIDAVYGTGFKHEIRDEMVKEIFNQVNTLKQDKKDKVMIISVDIPSGLDGDTGKAAESCIKADMTVALDCMKKGLLQESAAAYAGEVVVVDIGIPDGAAK